MLRSAMLVAVALMATGCANLYAVPAGKPVAYVMVSRARLAPDQDAKIYYLGRDPNAENLFGSKKNVISGYLYDAAIPIEAEIRTFLSLDIKMPLVNGSAYCVQYFAFTPEAAHTYRFDAWGSNSDECGASVVDTRTNAPPLGLERIDPM